jgi:hypothetical protein
MTSLILHLYSTRIPCHCQSLLVFALLKGGFKADQDLTPTLGNFHCRINETHQCDI